MLENSASQSGIFNPRVSLAFALCSLGAFLPMLSFTVTPTPTPSEERTLPLTDRVSVATDGADARGPSFFPSISADGRYVAFHSNASNLVPGDTNGTSDVFVYDRITDRTERISVATNGTQGNQSSYNTS